MILHASEPLTENKHKKQLHLYLFRRDIFGFTKTRKTKCCECYTHVATVVYNDACARSLYRRLIRKKTIQRKDASTPVIAPGSRSEQRYAKCLAIVRGEPDGTNEAACAAEADVATSTTADCAVSVPNSPVVSIELPENAPGGKGVRTQAK